MRVIVEADGGSRGNPGPAGYGSVVFAADGRTVLAERKEALGIATNNVAEYRGLIAGLEAAAELGATDVAVRMDSKLVVEQMSGRWQIKHPDMRPLARRAGELRRRFTTVSFEWIPRERNKHADRLANEAMDAAAGLGRTRPAPLVTEAGLPAALLAGTVADDAPDDDAVDGAAAGDAAGDAAVARADLVRRVRDRALRPAEPGQGSDHYFDGYLMESDPRLLRDVVGAMAALVPDGDVVLAGLELGGIPLVTLLGQRTGRAIRFVRTTAGDSGTQQRIEGGPVDGHRVVLIDVEITSGAVLGAVEAVRAAGATVDTAVGLVDRQRGGRSALVANGVAVRTVLTAADLVG